VATYEGKPIEAVFHASSYGMTDSMANVWGGGLPCLTGVETPETLDTPYVYETKTLTSAELRKKVLNRFSSAEFPSDPADWVTITKNEYGRVKTLQIGTASVTGQSARSLLGLASNTFKITYNKSDDTFKIETFGWGHGVGLSQYGAGIYADQGKDYAFIIKHYYKGVDLTLWKG